MGEELPQDRWFWVWLSIFVVVLGTSPFIIWDWKHPLWGTLFGVVALAGLLVLARDRLMMAANKWQIGVSLKVLAVVVLAMFLGQMMGYVIYGRQADVAKYPIHWLGYGLFLLLIAVVLSAALTKSPSKPSKLVIHSANYRAVEGGGQVYDVSEFLQKITSGDSLVFDIENHNFVVGNRNFVPTDPLPFKVKRLQVKYSYAGQPLSTIERYEHGRLVLPEDSEIARLDNEIKQLTRELEGTKVRHPERVVESQHRTERASTPAELRSMSYGMAGDLARVLMEHGKRVDSASSEEDGDLIDEGLLIAMKPFESRIAAIQTEFYQKGLLTDQVMSGDSPKTLVQVLQSTVASAPDVRLLIQALTRASQILEERFRLKDVRNRPKPELILGDVDPRVYVEVEDQRKGIQQQTPFRLINRGVQVAHNVQIGTLILVNGRMVNFPKVDSIAGGGGQCEVLPQVQGVGSIQATNIVRAMMESWNLQDDDLPQNECQAPLIVRYNDFSGRKEFETYTEIILFPIHEGLRRNRIGEDWTILEIRNAKFRRLS